MKFKIGTKGQISFISLAYLLFMLLVGIILVGFLLIVVNEQILGIHFYQLGLDYGVDEDTLNILETFRAVTPLVVLLAFGISAIAVAHYG